MTMGAAAARLLGEDVIEASPVGGGKNSRVFRIRAASGRLAALKAYSCGKGEATDRLDVEWRAFCLTGEAGLPVPRPLARDDGAGLAAFAWVGGDSPDPIRPDPEALRQCAAMAGALFTLARRRLSACPWPARAACLRPGAILDQIEARLSRLAAVAPGHALGPRLAGFLDDEFAPELVRRRREFLDGCAAVGLDPAVPLPEAALTLSPSDFGLHNARRGPDGRLTFLDFEYFGRDDPAKLTADFLLHPAMSLPRPARHIFREAAGAAFAQSPGHADRLRLLAPLVGLKWCLILLNEFLPEGLARRVFAGGGGGPEVLAAQLAKARAMLDRLNDLAEELRHG